MGQLLVPAMIGAGVGALGGAAMGKNPFKTALLGAGLGAGGAGLFGAGAAGAGTAAGTGAGTGTGLFGAAEAISPFTPTGVFGAQTMTPALTGSISGLDVSAPAMVAQNAPLYAGSGGMFDVAATQNQILGGIGPQAAVGGGGYDPSLWGSVQRGAESGYNTLADWAKTNPMQALSTTGQLAQAMTPQEQAQQSLQQAPPIRPGSYNVAPTLGQGQVGSKMQITPERLKVYPDYYFRGGY